MFENKILLQVKKNHKERSKFYLKFLLYPNDTYPNIKSIKLPTVLSLHYETASLLVFKCFKTTRYYFNGNLYFIIKLFTYCFQLGATFALKINKCKYIDRQCVIVN